MGDRVGGVNLNGSEGSMYELAESLSLVKFRKLHNNPADPFLMDEHQAVCFGRQFKDGFLSCASLRLVFLFIWRVQVSETGALLWPQLVL